MGIGGIGIWQLLIILVIVLLLFGTKKLRNLGGDLGDAIKSFKKAVNTEKGEQTEQPPEEITLDEGAGEQPVDGAVDTLKAGAAEEQGSGKKP